MQVIRIDEADRVWWCNAKVTPRQMPDCKIAETETGHDDCGWIYVKPAGDVIELTEERRPNTYEEAMELDPPAPHVRRRLSTDWKPVDGD